MSRNKILNANVKTTKDGLGREGIRVEFDFGGALEITLSQSVDPRRDVLIANFYDAKDNPKTEMLIFKWELTGEAEGG